MKYTYASEKFATARRSLMLPHPDGDTKSIADAFSECFLSLRTFNHDDLDDGAKTSLRKLEELMGTTGLDDPLHRGLYTIKAERLSLDQKTELSKEVDYLATWFDEQSRE
ncbi:MAG: hypothetical protein V3R25_01650 [Nitrosomonadaceae bacterium]